jgi:hypothetical protein
MKLRNALAIARHMLADLPAAADLFLDSTQRAYRAAMNELKRDIEELPVREGTIRTHLELGDGISTPANVSLDPTRTRVMIEDAMGLTEDYACIDRMKAAGIPDDVIRQLGVTRTLAELLAPEPPRPRRTRAVRSERPVDPDQIGRGPGNGRRKRAVRES